MNQLISDKPLPSRQIHILRTLGEWEFIQQKLQDQNYANVHAYLHREISRLTNLYEDCDVCVSPADGTTKRLKHNIPTHIYDKLLPLSMRMGKPMASVIDDLLIMPLLLPQKNPAL